MVHFTNNVTVRPLWSDGWKLWPPSSVSWAAIRTSKAASWSRLNLHAKGFGRWLLNVLVKRQPRPNGIEVGEVVRRQHLALDDRKVDFHLVEPTGMDRCMHQNDSRIDFRHPFARRLATVRRAVVHNPEQTLRRAVGLLRENLGYQSSKRFDSGRCFATPHHISAANVPGRQILQRSAALVFAFDPCSPARPRRQRRMDANAGLNARLLVRADDTVRVFQGFSVPMSRVQVKDRPGLFQELWVSRKDPILVLPGLDGILVQGPPYRAAADRLPQCFLRPRREIVQGLPTDRLTRFRDSLTSQGLDAVRDPEGEKSALRPRPAPSSSEKFPAAHRFRQR